MRKCDDGLKIWDVMRRNTSKQVQWMAAVASKSHSGNVTRSFLRARESREGVAVTHAFSVRNLIGTPDPPSLHRKTVFGDTIFALSTAQGRAGVAIVRVSGPGARETLALLPTRQRALTLKHREARPVTFACPETGEILDRGIIVWFDSARGSFTGEDVAELHVHGSSAVVRGILSALARVRCTVGGVDEIRMRHAEPGEFTRRAFHNGKLDLTQVEGLADLLDAETDAQRRQALGLSGGELSRIYEGWRRDLLRAASYCEAVLDFSDDEINSDEIMSTAILSVDRILRKIEATLLRSVSKGELVRNGVRVVLLGAPNVGKSSLLNALAGRHVAIVSNSPGTTRDAIEVCLELGGYKVIVTDTAGLRATEDPVELEGIKISEQLARSADLTVRVVDASDSFLVNNDAHIPGWMRDTGRPEAQTHLTVMNKSDLLEKEIKARGGDKKILVSSLTHEGLDHFVAALKNAVERYLELYGGKDIEANTRQRHRHHLKECASHLQHFIALTSSLSSPISGKEGSSFSDSFHSIGKGHELAAEELRLAARALGHITGNVDVEELLDVIFADFCCGK